MKYWFFQNNQVTGPYDREQIAQIKGFSAESLVCPEGRKGTEMGDWQRAGMVQELAESLLKGTTKVAAASGGSVGLLPPEPTLKDLAVMGNLQEKTQLLENALNQVQEDIRSRDAEISNLKEQLLERARAASEMRLKLSDMETRVAELGETASKVAALSHLEEDVSTLKQIIETQATTIESLKEKQTGSLDTAKPADAKPKEPFPVIDFAKDAAPPVAAPAVVVPAPEKQELQPQVIKDVTLEPILPPKLGPIPVKTEQPAASEAPALQPLKLERPKPELPDAKPPMARDAKKKSGPTMGRIADLETAGSDIAPVPAPKPEAAKAEAPKVEDLLSKPAPVQVKAAEPPKPAPVAAVKPAMRKPDVVLSTRPKKNSMRLVVIGLAVAVAAFALIVVVAKKSSKRKKASRPEPMPELNIPAPGSQAGPATAGNLPAANPAPALSAAGGPVSEQPKPAAPEAPLGQDPTQVAVDFAKNYQIPGTDSTLAKRLETAFPPTGGLSPWMIEKIDDDKYQVNYYAPGAKIAGPDGKSKLLHYEFIVHPKSQSIEAHNPPAESILKGEIPAPLSAKPAKKRAAAPKAPAAKRRTARKPRVKRAAAEKPADQGKLDENVLPTKKEGNAGSGVEGDVSLDQLLLPGVPKQAVSGPKNGKKKKPAADAEAAPADTPAVNP